MVEALSATFDCNLCGQLAATVTLVPAGRPDPRLTPEPAEVPPGISRIFSDGWSLSIEGGPRPFTAGWIRDPAPIANALREHDLAALAAVDSEYANFWCRRCGACYCRAEWRTTTHYDDGFFDYVEGFCPAGHRSRLAD